MSLGDLWAIAFWVSISLIAWTWVGYPLALFALTRLRRAAARVPETEDFFPSVTIIVAAHNEEQVIGKRIENCLALDYPSGKWDLIVVSDHSSDRTEAIIGACPDPRVRLLRAVQRGKSLAQNEAVLQAKHEIIVFSDADTHFDREFLEHVARPFADSRVGCVGARLQWTNPDASAMTTGGNVYWRLEHLLWQMESHLGLLAWTSGACMAFRRDLFRPMEPQYGDDCVVPLDIVAQGYRVVFQPAALAYEARIADPKAEFRARVRMTLRSFTGTLSRWPSLRPLQNPGVAWAVASHKLLRWVTPHFLALAFLSNLFLLQGPVYPLFLGLQVAFYLSALLGSLLDRRPQSLPLLSTTYAFCLMNCGVFIGVLKALLGHRVLAYRSEG